MVVFSYDCAHEAVDAQASKWSMPPVSAAARGP